MPFKLTVPLSPFGLSVAECIAFTIKSFCISIPKIWSIPNSKNSQTTPTVIEKQNKEKAKYETEEAVIKAVCEDMKVEIPQGMIETETQNMLKDIETRLSYQGLKLEQYLQMMGKTAEEVKKEYEPQAIEAIKSRLALEAIVKAEKIEASEEKINEKLEEMAKNYGKTAEELKANENVKNYIKEGIESQEAIEFLVKNAKIK